MPLAPPRDGSEAQQLHAGKILTEAVRLLGPGWWQTHNFGLDGWQWTAAIENPDRPCLLHKPSNVSVGLLLDGVLALVYIGPDGLARTVAVTEDAYYQAAPMPLLNLN